MTEQTEGQQPIMIHLNSVLAVPNPDDETTVYDTRLTNGDTFILIRPASDPDGKPVMLIDMGGGIDPLELANMLVDLGNTIGGYFSTALADETVMPVEGVEVTE